MFLNYINNFRGIAIFYIVAGHCISAFAWNKNSNLETLLQIVFLNGSVLFVFIAGYLFQYLSDKYYVWNYFKKKICWVILPYLIISVPAIIYFVSFAQRHGKETTFYAKPIFMQIIIFYTTGSHLAPYWFIPMITIFFIISPMLIWLDRNKAIYYFLPVFLFISCLVPRGGVPQSFVHFFFVYLLGMFFNRYRKKMNPFLRNSKVISLIFLITIFLIYYEYQFGRKEYISLFQKLFICGLYIGLLDKYDFLIKKKFDTLASNSFGLYFIHSYFISSLKVISIKINGKMIEGNLILYSIFVFFCVFICAVLILIIKKLLGAKSRYIVGC